MKFFLPIIYLLCISRSVFGKKIERERSNNDDELSYQELINMNVSCNPWDSCMQPRTDDPPVPANGFKCSCHRQCWEYGTCCINSPYRFKPPIQKCVNTKYGSYYMVHRCPDNTHPDSIWRSHCESKPRTFDFLGNPTDDFKPVDDILMIAPVTSLDTSRTYKNYYCFRCHESTDKYVFWNLSVQGDSDALNGKIVHSVAFNETRKGWVAILEESHVSVPVSVRFRPNMLAEPKACNMDKFIAHCSKKADERVNAKCLAYTAVVYTEHLSYKNVHCALCWNESLADLTCDPDASFGGGSSGSAYIPPNQVECSFNFVGEKCFVKEEEPKSCNPEYEVWSPQLKTCKKVVCAIRDYVPKNGICVPA